MDQNNKYIKTENLRFIFGYDKKYMSKISFHGCFLLSAVQVKIIAKVSNIVCISNMKN